MKKTTWAIWLSLGILFLLNAIIGRYWVLPGYLSSLETGQGTIETAAQAVPVWKIIRYLIWAYSFKLGVFLIGIGVLVKASSPSRRFWLMVSGGAIYILFAYIPVPGPYPLFFGLGGSLIAIMVVATFILWAREYGSLKGIEKASADYRLIGYFFLAMATYNLCPLMGVKAFGLYPEKMIRLGRQAEAVSFASRIMIELVLGWLFICISHFKLTRKKILTI